MFNHAETAEIVVGKGGWAGQEMLLMARLLNPNRGKFKNRIMFNSKITLMVSTYDSVFQCLCRGTREHLLH
ncbi:hypothetical protein DICVIV_08123 [Dictyocaulus viviparus]|uniref:Uncharacterized protein n=1 Tax=Dictyocaulus viviparus TaxID=29172 RepID=A0A0D8XMS7_DICVI|nr:hypothetical protein DICVIV_08123 [Dictyocaulus viviparus]